MSRPAAPTLGAALLTAGLAAGTTWVALLSWRGFTDDPAGFLVPLVVLAATVAAVGALGRWARLGVVAVLLLELLVGGMLTSYVICGSPLPVGAAWDDLRSALDLAVRGAETFAPPVPSTEADVAPLLVAGGLLCLVLVDLLAAGLRRTPLAGLPLLTIYSLPVGLVGTDLTWWVFALSALGFLTLLFRQEAASVGRWGRALEGPDRTAGTATGLQSAGVRLGAAAVGLSATALAVVVPLAIPTLDVRLLDIGRGGSGGDGIEIENPMVDLRRDLNRGEDVPLLRMRTDDPDPSYLRISVLNRFTANEWSSGDRQIPSENRPEGRMPELVGVAADVPRTSYDYDVEVLDDFESSWLPTMSPVTAVRAEGDWRYDESTMDFLAADEDLDTAGLRYSMTGVQLDLSAQELADAPSSAGQVSADFTDVPPGLPPLIRQLANDVTAGAPTRFQKAVALQDWFRENFTYSLDDVPPGNGSDDLVAFLSTEGENARTGYCEQFAAAMALMARQLGIPARVAVGFLVPDEVEDGVFEYSAYDLHAWPELFIAGSGWVRFEPTPADRASGVPTYTTQAVDGPDPISPGGRPEDDTANAGGPNGQDEPSAEPTQEPEAPVAADEVDQGVPGWVPVAVGWAAVVLLLVLLSLVPGAWRRARRARRLAGGPEQVWAEVCDTALDLGVPWPRGRSPRVTAAGLAEHLLGPVGPRGPGAALESLVAGLERLRYSRAGDAGAGAWGEAGALVVEALEAGARPRSRRRARWLPRTLLRPTRPADVAVAASPSTESDLVDHVG